jgi:hypothetical protein
MLLLHNCFLQRLSILKEVELVQVVKSFEREVMWGYKLMKFVNVENVYLLKWRRNMSQNFG